MPADDTEGMGLNPHRPQRRRPSDLLFVGAAAAACLALLVWALLG
ncbi:MAG: hypothetical protein R2694_16725 [Ilumatobacteraceae bacterium]